MATLEIVQHPHLGGVHLFFNTLDHRSLHIHLDWELVWVLDQPLLVSCGGQEHRVEPGELVLFSPGQPHEFHKAEGSCTFLCLQLDPAAFPAAQRVYTETIFPAAHLTEDETTWLKTSLIALFRRYLQRPPFYQLDCLGRVNQILYLLLTRLPVRQVTEQEAAERERRSARLMRLVAFVQENFAHKIRLSDFARQERRSLSYLSHFAREMLGHSFQEYVATVRFHHACHLMATTNKGMLAVCMESGFSDYRYFSRMFQTHFGMTPEAYRRRPKHSQAAQPQPTLDSAERFYSPEGSLQLLDKLEKQYGDKKASRLCPD